MDEELLRLFSAYKGTMQRTPMADMKRIASKYTGPLNQMVEPKVEKSTMETMAKEAINNADKPSYVAGLLQGKGYNAGTVAGFMGNIDVESAGSYNSQQKQIGGGSGHGLFQFTFKPMKKAYNEFLKKNNRKDDESSQIDFIDSAIKGNKDYELGWRARENMQKAMATGDAKIIAQAFSENVENPGKPHDKRRVASADKWFKRLERLKRRVNNDNSIGILGPY